MKEDPTVASPNKKVKKSELTYTKCNGTMHGIWYLFTVQGEGETLFPLRGNKSYLP
jgi:hypothetical protein